MATFNYLTPKRQDLMKQPQATVKNRLDAILESDFNLLKKQAPGEQDYSNLTVKNNNPLILDYVKGIYEEYNIADPLSKAQKKYETPTHHKMGKKIYINLYSSRTKKIQSPQMQQFQQSRLKTSKMLDVSRQKASDVVDTEITIKRQRQLEDSVSYRASMSYFDASFHERNEALQPRLNKSSAIRREKEKPLAVVNDQSQKLDTFRPRQPSRSEKDQSLFPNNSKPINSLVYEKRNMQSATSEESSHVNETFRYCVGCQKALLHVNIQTHQKICKQFQQVFQMNPIEIVQHLCQKIQKFERQVRRQSKQLQHRDVQELSNHSCRILEESRVIAGNGIMTEDYQCEYKQAMEIGSKWCMMTEQINKINWFLKIRQGIKKKVGL